MSSINSRGDASFVRSKVERTPKTKEVPVMPEENPAQKMPPVVELIRGTDPRVQPKKPKKGPMELLADLASKARQFAEELDNAALEIEQEFQNSEAKSEQLKQLKSLLKGIAD